MMHSLFLAEFHNFGVLHCTAPNVCQEEVEMEDAEEPVMDIDSLDRNDPLAVVEYIDDIYCFYKKTEVNLNI